MMQTYSIEIPWERITVEELRCLSEFRIDGDKEVVVIPMEGEIEW